MTDHAKSLAQLLMQHNIICGLDPDDPSKVCINDELSVDTDFLDSRPVYWILDRGQYNATCYEPIDVVHDVLSALTRDHDRTDLRTPLQKYESIEPAKTVAIDGKWLFELAAQDIPASELHLVDAEPMIVHITRQLAVRYDNLRAAHIGIKRSIEKWESEGRMMRDLSGLHGYAFNIAGELLYRVSPNGRVWPVTYLGKSTDTRLATSPCTRAMLGIEHSLLMQAR